jgi:hypothetical protein
MDAIVGATSLPQSRSAWRIELAALSQGWTPT